MNRNYGIDTLRLLAMLFVTCLHVLGQGGVLAGAEILSVNYILAWLLETLSFCAVNCFGLISGYVGVKNKQKFSNLVILLLQVCFYTILSTFIYTVLSDKPVSGFDVIKDMLPFGKYWYFDAYAVVFLLMPILNFVLRRMSPVLLRLMIAAAIVVCYFLPTSGYNFVWLTGLYMVGGAVALLDQNAGDCKKKTDWYLYVYILTVVAAWLVKICIEYAAMGRGAAIPDGAYLIKNTSPMMLLAALGLLRYFSGRSFSANVSRCIKWLSPLAFGVYLAHTEPHVWELLEDRFAAFATYHPGLLVLAVLGTAFAIWAACLAVDFLRLWIFKRLHLPDLCKTTEEKLRGWLCSVRKK